MALPVTPTSIETQSHIMMVGPPPVGLQAELCGGVGGGLCLALFEEICYTGGMVVTCAAGWFPPVCITIGVGAAAYAICVAAARAQTQFEKAVEELTAEIERRIAKCRADHNVHADGLTGDELVKVMDALAACLGEVGRFQTLWLDRLRRALLGDRGPGPSSSNPGGSPSNKPHM